MKKLLLIFSIISLTALSCKWPSSEKYNHSNDVSYNLSLHPDAGSSYQYDIINTTQITVELEERKSETINETNAGILYKVDKDSTGNYQMGISYTKLHLRTKNGDNESETDAQNARFSSDPTARMLAILKNASLKATITPSGVVKQVDGYKDLSMQLLSTLDPGDEAARDMAQQQLDKIIGSGMIQKNLDQMFKIFPDSAIHLGDKWKVSTTQKGDFNTTVKSTFHLDDINSEIAFVKSESDLEVERTPVVMMGSTVIPDLKGTQKAKYEIESQTGMLLNSEIESEIEGNLDMGETKLPIKIIITVRMNGQKIK
jgi:hypothetical protein